MLNPQKLLKKTRVIVDMQFGSTGKGLLAGFLAETYPCDTVVAAWGPNAGHTYIDSRGNKFVVTMLPNGVISPDLKKCLLGPGAVINPAALRKEIDEFLAVYPESGLEKKIFIHENAAVVRPEHRDREAAFRRIGSTSKGTAEAVIDKLRRDPNGRATVGQNGDLFEEYGLADKIVTAIHYDTMLDDSRVIQAEGAQGFSLGINRRFYPYTTSRECTANQVLSDCAIPMALNDVSVIGTLRTYPIRVANRFMCNKCGSPHGPPTATCPYTGAQVGSSGSCYPDQEEITFQSIGQETELTTVTKLPRRLFTFSEMQLRDALNANAPVFLFANFMNYLPYAKQAEFLRRVDNIAREYNALVRWYSDGPSFNDVGAV